MSTMSFPSCSCLLSILLYLEYPLHSHILIVGTNQEDLILQEEISLSNYIRFLMICYNYENVVPFFYDNTLT